MRALAILGLACSLFGCGDNNCAKSTVFVDLTLSGVALGADEIDVSVTIAGATITAKADRNDQKAHETLTLEFGDGKYPGGSPAVFTFSAVKKSGNTVLASTTETVTLGKSCQHLDVSLPQNGISATTDGGTGAGPDFAGCVSTAATCPTTQTCGIVDDNCGNTITCGTECQAISLSPRLANSTDILTIEGTFTMGATVDLPGAPGIVLGLSGSHRATITVPDGATAGPVVVHSGGQTLPVGNFRRASFALEATNLDHASAQLDVARQGVTIANARKFETLTEANGWIYVVGGSTASDGGSMPTGAVDRVRVNADGTLGYTDTLKSALVTPRFGHTAVVIGDRLYVIGGATSSASTDVLRSLEWATLNADGTLSAFTKVDDALLTARLFATVHVIGNQLTLIGGYDGSFDLGSIEQAPITGDTVGAFALVTGSALMTPRRGHASFATSGYLIVIGGEVGSGNIIGSIESATIDGNGVLSAFTPSTTSLPNPSNLLTGVVWGNALFAWPYIAFMGTNGNASMFVRLDVGIFNARHTDDTRTVVARDHLYMLTSSDSDQTTYDEFVYGALTESAALSPFTYSTKSALPETLSASAGAVIGDWLYLFGGDGDSGVGSTVYRAPVAADDTIGPFVDSGVKLFAPRFEHTLAVLQNRIVVMGGGDATLASQANVYSAAIAADDSIGAFVPAQFVTDSATATATLASAQRGLRALVVEDNLCVMGGYLPGGTYSGAYQCAELGTDGTLTTNFAIEQAGTMGPVSLVTPRAYFSTSYYQEQMAVYSGGSTSLVTSVETSQPSFSLQNASSWATSPTVTVPGGRAHNAALLVGNDAYLLGNGTATASLDLTAFDAPFTDAAAPLMEAHSDPAAFIVGNMAYVVGGTSSKTVEQSLLK